MISFMRCIARWRVNDRGRAHEILGRMRTEAPDHRLTLDARGVLAGYDHDAAEMLAVTDKLFEQFPRNAGLCLRRDGRRAGGAGFRRWRGRRVLASVMRRHGG
jgi:hypothetical protein